MELKEVETVEELNEEANEEAFDEGIFADLDALSDD